MKIIIILTLLVIYLPLEKLSVDLSLKVFTKITTDIIIEKIKEGRFPKTNEFLNELVKLNNNGLLKFFLSVASLTLSMFIPGMNIIASAIFSSKTKKIIENLDSVELSPDYVAKFKNLTKAQQIEEIKKLEEKTVIEEEKSQGSQLEEKDALTPLAYTLEEVKTISSSLNKDYVVGKIDGVNIALIGFSSEEIDDVYIELIQAFKEGGASFINYHFNASTEEEVANNRFKVFVKGLSSEEKDDISEYIMMNRRKNRDAYDNSYRKTEADLIKYHPELKKIRS